MKKISVKVMRTVEGGSRCSKCGTTYNWTGWWLHAVGLCSTGLKLW